MARGAIASTNSRLSLSDTPAGRSRKSASLLTELSEMTEPLSIAVGVIGIATFALQSVQQLAEFIESIKNAPSVIADIKQDLKAVEIVLNSLTTALQDKDQSAAMLEWLSRQNSIKVAVENCSNECTRFRAKMARWMSHSTESKTFWWDRVRAGYLGEKSTEAFRRRLGSCKATINMALTSVIFLETCHSVQSTEEVKAMLLKRETEIETEGSMVEDQIVVVNTQLQQLSIIRNVEESGHGHESRSEQLADLEQELTLLEGYRNICEAARSEIHCDRTGQYISNVKMDKDSRLMVGFINPEGEETQINQNIKDVAATQGSRGIVGVARNVNLDSFWN